MEIVAKGIGSRTRLRLIQLHRLIEFERVFNLYLKVKATSAQVKKRARLVLRCGLPRLR